MLRIGKKSLVKRKTKTQNRHKPNNFQDFLIFIDNLENIMLSENYKKYFKMMMDKHGIKSLDQLSAEEKKKFLDH